MMTRRTLMKTAAALASVGAAAAHAATQSVKSAGFYYPEEAGPHERTFMQWPVSRRVHSDTVFLKMLQQTIADIANAIAEFEPVVMLMDAKHEKSARRILSDQIEIWDVATEDLWARDSGPSFVIDGKGGLAMTHFNFNGWGNKQLHRHDGQVAARVAKRLDLKLFDAGLVGEAGGAEFDGEGTLIAHASSWVNSNRNRAARKDVESMLRETYGAEKVIWAPGIKGADITDYHIDALARFVEPGKLVIQMPDAIDPDDQWTKAAFQTYDILRSETDANGRKLELVRLPEPMDPRVRSYDFVASYVNYYVCNGAVVASQFGDRYTDDATRDILSGLYPGRRIVMLNTDPVGEVGGGIHCATHEQPKI